MPGSGAGAGPAQPGRNVVKDNNTNVMNRFIECFLRGLPLACSPVSWTPKGLTVQSPGVCNRDRLRCQRRNGSIVALFDLSLGRQPAAAAGDHAGLGQVLSQVTG